MVSEKGPDTWREYEVDLWLRYKSKTVDLVWLKRTCKVKLGGRLRLGVLPLVVAGVATGVRGRYSGA
jgi:hypothetical protein